MSSSELATVYASLILADDNVDITADKLQALCKAANVDVEPVWVSLFAKALEGRNVADLLMNVGAGGGGAAPAAAGAAAGGEAEAAKVEEKEEEKEESDDDMGFGILLALFLILFMIFHRSFRLNIVMFISTRNTSPFLAFSLLSLVLFLYLYVAWRVLF